MVTQIKQLIFGLILIFIGFESAQSQRNVKDSIISTPWIGVHYGANWTSGDLADRYGFLNHIGGTAGYKTNKNWFWGVDGNFIFGNQVRMTGIFDGLVDSFGNITDINGDIGLIYVFARGFNANVAVGKIIPVASINRNSGIWVHGGLGYLQHKMRIETQEQVIPSLELEYRKGYDRFTTGLNAHGFLGYAFLANQGFVNCYGGLYGQFGFTQNRREIFFDQPDIPVDKSTRLDVQLGLRAGWFIPIYKRKPKDFYFN
jgi:hypothetical protein